MKPQILKDLKKDFEKNKKQFRSFINRQENKLDESDLPLVKKAEKYAWTKVNCLDCANCCKTMSPVYTKEDITRISAHLKMTSAEFKKKWLQFDKKDRTWMNTGRPCQFLDLKTNKCTIYKVRPAACAEFPHLTKMPFKDYLYIHKQNIEYCPATFEMIKKLKSLLANET